MADQDDLPMAHPARIKQPDGPAVSDALQRIQSEYDCKAPALDLLVERMKEYHGDAAFLRLQWRDEPVYWLPNEIMTTHAAFKPWMELQKLMHATVKEMASMIQFLEERKPAEDDPVDTFLENIERVNRPHRSVNRAGG